MLIEDVDAEDARARKQVGEARRDLPRATTAIENMKIFRKLVPADQLDLLWPDGECLRGEVPHHRLVRHLLRLRVEIAHDVREHIEARCVMLERLSGFFIMTAGVG